MSTLTVFVALLLLIGIEGNEIKRPVGGTGDVSETAPYTVLRALKDYEERVYPARKWVRTDSSEQGSSSGTAAFWKLFGYISGEGNERKVKIPMTSPVTSYIEPSDCSSSSSSLESRTMAFFITSDLQENPPEPTGSMVSIENRLEMKVFARTFGGFANNDTSLVKSEHEKLWSSLSGEDKSRVDRDGPYYLAGYDPPFKLENRRNEIWMILKDPEVIRQEQKVRQQSCTSKTTATDQ